VVQVIAFTSGKGGVGKTNASLNIAVSLQKNGGKVLLLDADLGLANIDVMVGLYSEFNLSHVLLGQKSIQEILIEGPAGIHIVPSASGVQKMAQLTEVEIGRLIQAFSELADDYDYLLIDTAAGIAEGVLSFLQAAHHVVVVAVDEPSSVTDAYAMIKVMTQQYQIEHIWLLANMVNDAHHGKALFNKINQVTEKFLSESIHYLDAVPADKRVKESNQNQTPVSISSPSSLSATAYLRAAKQIAKWEKPTQARGNMEFFVERYLNRASA
jgi:flagellar biosynthesis protein FlhG